MQLDDRRIIDDLARRSGQRIALVLFRLKH